MQFPMVSQVLCTFFTVKLSDKNFNQNKAKQNILFRGPFCSNMNKNEFSAEIRAYQFLDVKVVQLHEKKLYKANQVLLKNILN